MNPFLGITRSRFASVLPLVFAVFLLAASSRPVHAKDCTNCTVGGGYWVVSTYTMPQSPGCCPKNFNFSCYYKPVHGKMENSSVGQMQESLDPNAPTCVFIHGSFVDIDGALNEARFTYSWLRKANPGCPLNMIFLVWPSNDVDKLLPGRSVVHNGLLADHNGIYLAHLMDMLPPTSPLCLMGHSHGTRLISAALHYRAGGSVLRCTKPDPSAGPQCVRAVFAAAAINHEWLGPENRYGLALTQVNSLLTLINRKDIALMVYPLVSPRYGRALSKSGVTIFDRRHLGPYLNKIEELDLTLEIGFRHSWSIYYSNPQLAYDISNYIYRDYRSACCIGGWPER